MLSRWFLSASTVFKGRIRLSAFACAMRMSRAMNVPVRPTPALQKWNSRYSTTKVEHYIHHSKGTTRNAAMRRNQVFNDSTKYWYDWNKKWKMAVKKKMMPLSWLHWLHAPSLVSIGLSKLKLLSGNWISIFSNSDLDLDHRHQGSNPKLRLDVSCPYSKFGVNRPKQTKVIERKLNFYF